LAENEIHQIDTGSLKKLGTKVATLPLAGRSLSRAA
jgi:hypothetical protein